MKYVIAKVEEIVGPDGFLPEPFSINVRKRIARTSNEDETAIIRVAYLGIGEASDCYLVPYDEVIAVRNTRYKPCGV